MNLEKFTIKSQEAIQQAQQVAMDNEHQMIDTSHLLKGILEVDENVLPYIFKKSGVSPDRIAPALDLVLQQLPKVSGAKQYLSDDANKALQKALQKAQSLNDEFVSIEHLLLGILDGKDKTARLLREHNLSDKVVMSAIHELRKGSRVTSASAEENYNSLNKYGKNLNEFSFAGQFIQVRQEPE